MDHLLAIVRLAPLEPSRKIVSPSDPKYDLFERGRGRIWVQISESLMMCPFILPSTFE